MQQRLSVVSGFTHTTVLHVTSEADLNVLVEVPPSVSLTRHIESHTLHCNVT